MRLKGTYDVWKKAPPPPELNWAGLPMRKEIGEGYGGRPENAPIITGIGKAFGTLDTLPKIKATRKYQPNYAAWEIQPVMKLDIL